MTFRFSLLAFTALSCSPGELHLTTEDTDAQSLTDDAANTPDPTESEDSPNIGGQSSEAPPGPDSFDEDAPCFVNDECLADCSPSNSDCSHCETGSDCPEAFPHCSESGHQCVECLNSTDCSSRFGPHFAVCDRGRCVQCQRDTDCGSVELECDRGWCGSCDHDSDCDPDSRCSFGRCIPD